MHFGRPEVSALAQRQHVVKATANAIGFHRVMEGIAYYPPNILPTHHFHTVRPRINSIRLPTTIAMAIFSSARELGPKLFYRSYMLI